MNPYILLSIAVICVTVVILVVLHWVQYRRHRARIEHAKNLIRKYGITIDTDLCKSCKSVCVLYQASVDDD